MVHYVEMYNIWKYQFEFLVFAEMHSFKCTACVMCNVQYTQHAIHFKMKCNLKFQVKTNRCKNNCERSVMPLLTCCGNLEARVFGYMNGASLSTKTFSSGNWPLSKSLRTPVSDLSYDMSNVQSNYYQNSMQTACTLNGLSFHLNLYLTQITSET